MSKPLLALPALLLTLAAPALADAPSPVGGDVVGVHDFATLSFHEALALRGRPARYAFVVDSAPGLVGDCLAFDCASPAGESRTVYLRPGQVPPSGCPSRECWRCARCHRPSGRTGLGSRGSWSCG
jgi:hypothetical protein